MNCVYNIVWVHLVTLLWQEKTLLPPGCICQFPRVYRFPSITKHNTIVTTCPWRHFDIDTTEKVWTTPFSDSSRHSTGFTWVAATEVLILVKKIKASMDQRTRHKMHHMKLNHPHICWRFCVDHGYHYDAWLDMAFNGLTTWRQLWPQKTYW